jgi:peptidoglycan/LPS O-acetylase OafA/YrhL
MYILYTYFNIGIMPNILNIESNTQYLECFFIGILAAFVNFRKVDINLWNKNGVIFNKKILFILWLVLVAFLLLISKSGISLIGIEALYHLRYLTIFYAVVFGLTLIYISSNQVGFLSNKFLVYTGKIGFSLYLLHFPIIAIVNKMSPYGYTALNFVISMLLVYLLSAYTFKYVELPFIKYANSK